MILILWRNWVEALLDELVEKTRNLIKTTSIEIEKWRQNGPLFHVKVHRTIQLPFFSPLGHMSHFSHCTIGVVGLNEMAMRPQTQLGLGKMERTQVHSWATIVQRPRIFFFYSEIFGFAQQKNYRLLHPLVKAWFVETDFERAISVRTDLEGQEWVFRNGPPYVVFNFQ